MSMFGLYIVSFTIYIVFATLVISYDKSTIKGKNIEMNNTFLLDKDNIKRLSHLIKNKTITSMV